jgi:hypothetical protein
MYLKYANGIHSELIKKLKETYYKKLICEYPNLYQMFINSIDNIDYDFMCNVLKIIDPKLSRTALYDKYDDEIRHTEPDLYKERLNSQFGLKCNAKG